MALVGQEVVISGVRSKPELNGSHGQCVSFDEVKGRYGVSVNNVVGLLALKPENVCDAFQSMGISDFQENVVNSPVIESKTMRVARKTGVPVFNLSGTSFGLVGPSMPIPDGVPANFGLKQAATNAFREGPTSVPGRLGNLRGERAYRLYMEDIEDNTVEWMAFFDHKDNSDHAEHTCGILGTLATIYRQRGDLQDCERVLGIEHEVLTRYQRSSVGSSLEQQFCCDGLAYKYRTIRYNLCLQTERYRQCVELFREQAIHEAKYAFDYESSNYHFMVTAILGKEPTVKVIKQLSDTDVMRIVMAPLQHEQCRTANAQFEEGRKQLVQLKTCASCGRQEDAVRAFKVCARCDAVFYCGRECQKADWKAHKKTCKAN